jgi:hypothetical protein
LCTLSCYTNKEEASRSQGGAAKDYAAAVSSVSDSRHEKVDFDTIDASNETHAMLKSALVKRITENMTQFIQNFQNCSDVLHASVCAECEYGVEPLQGVPPKLRDVEYL